MKKASGEVKKLLKVIGELQDLFGEAKNTFLNDRQADRAGKLIPILEKGFNICIEATAKYERVE